jgi:hypothetical protein
MKEKLDIVLECCGLFLIIGLAVHSTSDEVDSWRMMCSGMLCRVVLTRVTQRNIPEDTILHCHRRENPKSHKCFHCQSVCSTVLMNDIFTIKHCKDKSISDTQQTIMKLYLWVDLTPIKLIRLGYLVFWTIASQMAVKFSPIHAGHTLPEDNFWCPFLLDAVLTPGPYYFS